MDGGNNVVVTKEKTYISKVGEIIEKRQEIEIENLTENVFAMARNSSYNIKEDDNSSKKNKKKKWKNEINLWDIEIIKWKINKSFFQIKSDFF